MTDQQHSVDAEVLSGAKSIAKFLGMTVRQFRYFDGIGVLPTFKVQRTSFARRSSLREWLADQEQRARSDREARAKAARIGSA